MNYDGIDRRVKNSGEPLPTQTGQEERGLFMAPIIISRQGDKNDRAKSSDESLPTQLTDQHDSVLFPPLITDAGWSQNKPRVNQADADPLSTQDTGQTKGIILPFLIKNYGGDPQKPVRSENVLGAITGQDHHGLVNLPLIDSHNRTDHAKPATEPIDTVLAGGNHHGLLNTPLMIENMGHSNGRPSTERLSTLTTHPKHGIITQQSFNSFLTYYNKTHQASGVFDPVATFPTKERVSLVTPNSVYQKPKYEDCYYRMLLPEEIQLGMAFDADYIVLGDSKQRVKQLGNAVTPPVMEFLVERGRR